MAFINIHNTRKKLEKVKVEKSQGSYEIRKNSQRFIEISDVSLGSSIFFGDFSADFNFSHLQGY